MFTWKAAVFPGWGSGLLCTTVAVTLALLLLLLRRFSWRSKVSLSVLAVIGTGVLIGFGLPRRPFNLFRANLSDQWLQGAHLEGANLMWANLKGAFLQRAHLEHAILEDAQLEGADLAWAQLEGANLIGGHLRGAHFVKANLKGAHLDFADLTEATGLTTKQLAEAYGDAETKLPPGVARPASWSKAVEPKPEP
jgi:hypothetical protein